MPTFTEVLPGSASVSHRAMRYTPACRGVGVLELDDPRLRCRYAVSLLPFGGVRLTKRGGTDNYVVTESSCECAGFVYSETVEPCKHIHAVRALLDNGWLDADDRESVRDVAAEVEEQDEWWLKGPNRLADDQHADALGRTILQEPLPC